MAWSAVGFIVEQPVNSERPADIIATAAAAGFSVSERQLKRWHFEGLIPKPTQVWSEGFSGSETSYPTGTTNQTVALCKIHQKYRFAKNIGWQLWWLGFAVDQKYWKSILNDRAVGLDKYIPKIIKAIKRNNDAAGRFTKWRIARTRNFLFRQLRKRLGPDDFDGFISLMATILDGTFDGWNAGGASDDPDLIRDQATVDKALGLRRLKFKPKEETKPQTYEDVEAVLVMLSSRLGGIRFTELLKDSSDNLLISTRNEMRALFVLLLNRSAHDTISSEIGINLTAFAKFANLAAWRTHQVMLLFLLALKEDAEFGGNLTRFLDAIRCAGLASVSEDQLNVSRIRDPALVEFLYPRPQE